MNRFHHVFLGCLIGAKIAVALGLLCWEGGQGFFFQGRALAFEEEQRAQPPFQDQSGTGKTELSELKALLRLKQEIEKESEGIRRERIETLAIQEEIDRKLAELSRLRDEIRAQMETKKFVEEQRMKHLVKAYSAMKPQIAAGLIEKLELPFAVEMLSRMQGDAVGSILSFVDKEKAARISQGLVQPR